MSTLQNLVSKSAQTAFDKKVLSAIQHLQAYTKHRLYIAEATGIIPKNMYHSNGVIDDGIIKLYKSSYDVDSEAMAIKLKLFQLIDKDLDTLFEKEAFHKNTISTDTILKVELDRLKEDYTVEGDLDLVLETELNDISYKQEAQEPMFLYNDNDSNILKSLDIADLSTQKSPRMLGKFYSWLPMNVSKVIDLYVFGNLSFEDIARLKQIEVARVMRIMDSVKKNFRRNLN
jgi:hypothetical protein